MRNSRRAGINSADELLSIRDSFRTSFAWPASTELIDLSFSIDRMPLLDKRDGQ